MGGRRPFWLSNVASSIDASSNVAISIDASSNVASSIDASSNVASSNVASSNVASSNVASSILHNASVSLNNIWSDLVQTDIALEERLDKHGSRLYKLENLDIPHQVNKAVDEIVMDAIDWAIQAPLRDRFRDLPEADMKEILHHRM
ncbi:hypothetical protein Tco_0601402 [Tanacetum coccineum]